MSLYLKPCPFCGKTEIADSGIGEYKCKCLSCGAETRAFPSWRMAEEAWNRRYEEKKENADEGSL